MRVLGVDAAGTVLLDEPLPHGASPDTTAYEAGFVVQRPRDAWRDDAGELVVRLQVVPRTSESPPPPAARRGQDTGLVVPPGVVPRIRQRCAAYAVVTSDLGLLATEYSERTAVPGRWGMPGGGIDRTEQPVAAVLREVQEETSQAVELGELVRLQSSHWLGRSPAGHLEDFHAVRLVYRARCPVPTRPVVLDEGGTTESARWVPLDAWRSLTWTRNWFQVLGDLFGSS